MVPVWRRLVSRRTMRRMALKVLICMNQSSMTWKLRSRYLLEPNGRYILAAGYIGTSNTAFTAFNDNVRADFLSTILYIGGEWGGTFEGRPNAVLRMYLTLFTSADNNPLAETALNAFPNPTADVVSLKVKFEEPTDATITIADINGRVVRTENRAAMLDETVTYQMPQLASGTYLARIATEKGTRTLKFVARNKRRIYSVKDKYEFIPIFFSEKSGIFLKRSSISNCRLASRCLLTG